MFMCKMAMVDSSVNKEQVAKLAEMVISRIQDMKTDFVYKGLDDIETVNSIANLMATITDVLVELDKEQEFSEEERIEVFTFVIFNYIEPNMGNWIKLPIIGKWIKGYVKKKIRTISIILVKYLDKILWDENHVSASRAKRDSE